MVQLTEKEAVGVYLLLESRVAALDDAMARLRKRIEESLLGALTVEDFQDLESLYERLPARPPEERKSG